MERKDAFSDCHPLVNFCYFLLVLLFSMFFMHPACLAISLCAGMTYNLYLRGRRALRSFLHLLPLLLLTALVNPLFSHAGLTVLGYFPSGNPLTLESILYGLAAAALLAALFQWFSCCTVVLQADKFVYLFGRVVPALSLLLSMSLRFIPRFGAQWRAVADAQRGLGRDVSNGPLWRRVRYGVKIFSILVTWALENAIETADSMKSRGYGLPGRTAFSIYRFTLRDGVLLGSCLAAGAYVLAGRLTGALEWHYFPAPGGGGEGLYALSVFVLYFALCMMPLALDLVYDRRWAKLNAGAGA